MKITPLFFITILLSGCTVTQTINEPENSLDTVCTPDNVSLDYEKYDKDSYSEVKKVWSVINFHIKKQNTKKRKLVVFLDGTTNDKKSNTNIWKLYKLSLQKSCSANIDNPVIPYYDRGVGANWYDKITGSAFGTGEGFNILQAYNFLVKTYQKGDEIYIFGFSRGAFTARSLNGMLKYVGLLKRNRFNSISEPSIFSKKEELIMYDLYRAYKTHHDGTPSFIEDNLKPKIEQAKQEFGTDVTHDITVSAIGVFDTVPALNSGLDLDPRTLSSGSILDDDPDNHRTDLYATEGYHALSIDEQRKAFRLLRFNNTYNPKTQKLEEVWFAGVHENVGGGDHFTNGLAKISRDWMISKFVNHHIFPPKASSLSCEKQALECEGGELSDEFFNLDILWNKGGTLHRKPKHNDFIHGSVFCRMNISPLKYNHVKRESKKVYQTFFIKNDKSFYPNIVDYQCAKKFIE